jgi:hypothetical protein
MKSTALVHQSQLAKLTGSDGATYTALERISEPPARLSGCGLYSQPAYNLVLPGAFACRKQPYLTP